MKNKKTALRLTESAVMIALASVLSLFKLINLPYGGSVTVASMLPILIIAVRYGVKWGVFTGIVHGTLQLIIDPSPLGYFTSWQSLVAIIVLDYIIAFGAIGIGGIVRKIKKPALSLPMGAAVAGVLRYFFHVISGATVWAGLSIPNEAALVYSFGYNATYMLPETLVIFFSAYFVSSAFDFRRERISRAKVSGETVAVCDIVAAALFSGAMIFDTVMIFSKLQNAETGAFDFSGISKVNFPIIIAVTAVCVGISAVLFLRKRKSK